MWYVTNFLNDIYQITTCFVSNVCEANAFYDDLTITIIIPSYYNTLQNKQHNRAMLDILEIYRIQQCTCFIGGRKVDTTTMHFEFLPTALDQDSDTLPALFLQPGRIMSFD